MIRRTTSNRRCRAGLTLVVIAIAGEVSALLVPVI
tara:strand:+ start:395 stop:499 length:105 start_codon:yes stop_codon:yes gene_type:complete